MGEYDAVWVFLISAVFVGFYIFIQDCNKTIFSVDFFHVLLIIFPNMTILKKRTNSSSDNSSIKHTTFIFFLGDIFLLSEIPYEQTLGFTAITNLTLFNVTNASIINFDILNKFFNLSSTTYKTLCYQV